MNWNLGAFISMSIGAFLGSVLASLFCDWWRNRKRRPDPDVKGGA